MKQKRNVARSFDELIRGYYGAAAEPPPLGQLADEVIARYYGGAAVPRRKPTVFVSLDTGEVLPQRRVSPDRDDYLGARRGEVIDVTPDEYIVTAPAPVTAASAPMAVSTVAGADGAAPLEEYLVDVREPLRDSPGAAPAPAAAAAPEARIEPPAPATPGAPAPVGEPPAAPAAASSRPQATDDDFMADMKSILSGRKVFDPKTGRTVERDRLARPASLDEPRADAPPPAPNAHAIFDRIAKSMAFANAYDVGTVEVTNRFADFDRIDEAQRTAEQKKRAGNGKSAGSPAAGTADFVEDLQAIRARSAEPSPSPAPSPSSSPSPSPSPAPAPSASPAPAPSPAPSAPLSEPEAYSAPFFDTGEHVLLGGELYPDRLHLGKSPGVAFSYGEIVAMADLYKDVDQAMGADLAELRRIKELIGKSTAYYRGQKRDDSLDVADATWDEATRDRYLDLAEDNYQHFSPYQLFKGFTYAAKRAGDNNKAFWEAHHRRAIGEAQRSSQGAFPDRALVINAFGDHYLTDAFSAGHLINKEEIIRFFKDSFLTGSSLKPESEKFFAQVAARAFKGEVRKKFSVLETYDPVFLWWNPNIDTENAFRKLLVKAMEQQPDTVGNLAVKALHDRLNRDGVQVVNDAGDSWKAFGDQYLGVQGQTVTIARRAVAQSAANIEDPAIRSGNPNLQTLFARVWRHVPRLPEASRQQVATLALEYTRPDSETLKAAAADLITRKVDSFIKKLKKMHKLKDA